MSMAVRHAWDEEVMLRLLSKERMATYIDATAGSFEAALVLYNRNIQLAAALQGMTAMVEVVARNAIDQAITEWNAKKHPHTDWFDLVFSMGVLRKTLPRHTNEYAYIALASQKHTLKS